MPVRHLRLCSLLATALAALPLTAGANSLTLDDDDSEISIDECENRGSQSIDMSWDLSSSSGSSIEILGSNESGCSTSDATTAVLVSDLGTSQTSYPSSGDSTITLADVLSAAGKTVDSCSGSDFYVYVCVRLLDSSGVEVTTSSAAIRFQLTRPPPPTDLTVGVGENSLYVSFTNGTTTTAAPASSKTYRAFASAGGSTFQSDETTSKSKVQIGGLENGTTYDVWVVAYSEAGNASEASEKSAGTPQPVSDFYELYKQQGGVENGGCNQGGDGSWLALLLAAGVARAIGRRGRRRQGSVPPAPDDRDRGARPSRHQE
jgi:hypothetical protein